MNVPIDETANEGHEVRLKRGKRKTKEEFQK